MFIIWSIARNNKYKINIFLIVKFLDGDTKLFWKIQDWHYTVHSQETYLHFSEVHWITDDVKDAEIATVVTVVIMVCVIND